jgi:hypothetical protein
VADCAAHEISGSDLQLGACGFELLAKQFHGTVADQINVVMYLSPHWLFRLWFAQEKKSFQETDMRRLWLNVVIITN